MTILYLITARAGSNGIPFKNMQEIGGLSLIGWKTIPAVELREDTGGRVVISTDSRDMAKEGQRYGAEILMRPAEFATDEATTESVISHAMNSLGVNFTDIMLLEPSSPFATVDHMRAAINLKAERKSDLVCGMRENRPHQVFVGDMREDHSIAPIIAKMRNGHRRQDYPTQWTMNGAMYLFSADMFLRTGDRYGSWNSTGLLMDDWHSIEIDTPYDLAIARHAYYCGHVGKPA